MKRLHRQILQDYWQSLIKYPKYVVGILVGQTLGIGDMMLTPYLYKLIIDLVSSGSTNYEQVFFYLGLTLISGLTLGQAWRIAGFAAIAQQTRVMKDIANRCFQYLQNHSYNFFAGNFTGALVKRVNRYVNSYESITDRVIWNLQTLTIRTILVLVILALTSWHLAVAFTAWLTVFLIILKLYLDYHAKYDTAVANAETSVTAQLADSITNFENIKLFSNFKHEFSRYGDRIEFLRQKQVTSWNHAEWYFMWQGVYMVASNFGIMYLALKLWQWGNITIGSVVLIQYYMVQIMFRVWDLSHVFKGIYRDLSNAEEMMEIFNTNHEIKDHPKAKELKVTAGGITFNKVTYIYDNQEPVFNKLNMQIKPQEKVALVGASGAGKSTFVKLILRFYDLEKGTISIDGQKIHQVTQDSLREAIAFVPQDSIMFHRTIMENIRYGRLDATDEEVIEAAKHARCHDFIMASAKGYQTMVGERGIKLSGGERQRVAIARAILKNAPILILDEATSSLDSRSERLIQEALHDLMENKTVIAIAHRLSTVREMDRIIVLENGEILEEGHHDELIRKDAHYAELWKLQSDGRD